MVVEDGHKGGGLQPDGAGSVARAPFLPVERWQRLLCCFLLAVIVVAGYHAFCSAVELADALQAHGSGTSAEMSGTSAETDDLGSGFSGSGGGKIGGADEVPVIRGDDGKEYVVFSGEDRYTAKFGTAKANTYMARFNNVNRYDYGGITRELANNPYSCLSSGVYRFDSQSNNHLAVNPYTAFGRWLGTKWLNSAVREKLARTGVGVILGFSIQTAALTGADYVLAEDAPAIEAALVETVTPAMEAAEPLIMELTSDGATVFASDLTVATTEVLAQNAARGTAIASSEELAAQIADEYVAMAGGRSGEFVTDIFLEKLANGLIACEDLPWLAQAGQWLAEFGGYELSAFPDADGFTGSGGGGFPEQINVGSYPVDVASKPYYESDSVAGMNHILDRVDYPTSYYTDADDVYIADSAYQGEPRVMVYVPNHYVYQVRNGSVTPLYPFNSQFTPEQINFGSGVNIHYCGRWVNGNNTDASGFRNAVDNSLVQNMVNYEVGGSPGAVTSAYENGTQLIGNDAQFDSGGNLVDAGNADLSQILYDDGFNPTTWNQVLDAAGLNAVNSASENPAATDEVQAGENTGETLGDVTGNSTPGGSASAVPRAQLALDNTMSDLGGDISNKFPFSIPFNVSRAVNMLVATPEAPHFTWVFAVPTGDVEYEVDLAPFSPVASVLRVMLDIALVFSVIALLAKIAQIWDFFDKSAE